MVLIFTNKEDSHPNFVIEHLADAGVPVFRLNTEALLTDYEFSWWADASACDFVIRCKASGLTVRGSEVTAVWDRRPEKPAELPVQNTALINKHNLDEAFGFLYFIRYYLKDIPSIGSIANDRPASSKMLQLRYALDVGFKIPDTCFTNIKAAVTEHLADDRDYVLKPIESDNVWDEAADSQWVFFAARTSAQNLREAPDEAYSQTVTFLQEYVDKAFELRVTVVGDRTFACRIDSQAQQDDTGKIDWRQGYGHGIRWSVFSLPEDISRKCFAYLRRMGLNFGCFDFIVTPSGEYVFLECNPNGQWLWVELETGLPISQAIAEFLSEVKNLNDNDIG